MADTVAKVVLHKVLEIPGAAGAFFVYRSEGPRHLTLKPQGLAVCLRGKIVEIYDFPDGRLEVRWKGRPLPYSAFDKLQRVSHAAIVENKRLGEVLAWIKEQQDRQPRFAGIPAGPRRSD